MSRISKGCKKTFKLVGGPWDGQKVQLYSVGTLEFTVKSFDTRPGRYTATSFDPTTLAWEFTK